MRQFHELRQSMDQRRGQLRQSVRGGGASSTAASRSSRGAASAARRAPVPSRATRVTTRQNRAGATAAPSATTRPNRSYQRRRVGGTAAARPQRAAASRTQPMGRTQPSVRTGSRLYGGAAPVRSAWGPSGRGRPNARGVKPRVQRGGRMANSDSRVSIGGAGGALLGISGSNTALKGPSRGLARNSGVQRSRQPGGQRSTAAGRILPVIGSGMRRSRK